MSGPESRPRRRGSIDYRAATRLLTAIHTVFLSPDVVHVAYHPVYEETDTIRGRGSFVVITEYSYDKPITIGVEAYQQPVRPRATIDIWARTKAEVIHIGIASKDDPRESNMEFCGYTTRRALTANEELLWEITQGVEFQLDRPARNLLRARHLEKVYTGLTEGEIDIGGTSMAFSHKNSVSSLSLEERPVSLPLLLVS